MGLDCSEHDLKIGDKVLINGNINFPEKEWEYAECIYNGHGKFTCDKLMMNDATEEAITLALLAKYNSLLPKKKTIDDLKNLNIFVTLSNNVKGISFSSDRFNFLLQQGTSLKFFDTVLPIQNEREYYKKTPYCPQMPGAMFLSPTIF